MKARNISRLLFSNPVTKWGISNCCVCSCLNWQAVMEIYTMYRAQLSMKNVCILFDAMHAVALHAHKINSNAELCAKFQEFGSVTQMQDPPLENESYQICLMLLQNLMLDRPPDYDEAEAELYLVHVCREVLEFYIETS
ncbi:hypothetical protein Nepgr_025451 [Nepenthes gracilis]|uniref:Sec7/BIG1-like C-terminal domain-containing protein n=1 Tax=Nepenthes gracilis TaxID=150966 RepID=A0AAD3XZP2_NEPGR|nr:hypothetical protein Nepgr_025451 [Nepenthes gracilis]